MGMYAKETEVEETELEETEESALKDILVSINALGLGAPVHADMYAKKGKLIIVNSITKIESAIRDIIEREYAKLSIEDKNAYIDAKETSALEDIIMGISAMENLANLAIANIYAKKI